MTLFLGDTYWTVCVKDWIVTALTHKWFRGEVYTHTHRNKCVAKCQFLANLEKFKEFFALFLQLFCYIFFFQIKSCEKYLLEESKSSSHITRGGTLWQTLISWCSFSISNSLFPVVPLHFEAQLPLE